MSKLRKNKKREKAEDSVARELDAGGPFVAVVQNTRMPIVFSDPHLPGNPIIFANDSFLKLTGYEHAEVLGQSYHFMMGKDTDQDAKAQIESAFQEGVGATNPEVLYHRKDGSHFWAIAFVGPVLNEQMEVIQHFVSFVDVTSKKQVEQRTSRMLDELDHRVKNTLSIVQAIATQSLSGSALAKEVGDAFKSRIFALTAGHNLLAQESWRGANLREVIAQVTRPFAAGHNEASRISLVGEDTFVGPEVALGFALMLQELAANASKYGALLVSSGHIDIVWHTESCPKNSHLRLRWQERGGPPVSPPSHKGFGTRLIERVFGQENNAEVRLNYHPAGVTCEVAVKN